MKKILKTALFSIIGLVVLMPCAFADISEYEISIPAVSGAVGETGVSIPINLTAAGSDEISSADLWFTYDADLIEITAVERGNLTADWSIHANIGLVGEVKIGLFSAGHIPDATTGVLARIIVSVKTDYGNIGSTSPLVFTKNKLAGLVAPKVDGSFTVQAPIYTLSASAGAGGAISPSGAIDADHFETIKFTLSHGDDYHIDQLLVDGSAVTSC